MKKRKEAPNTNEIQVFMHCKLCAEEIAELDEDESPQSYARYEFGGTIWGYQLWCLRHDVNIFHIDFEGQKHPANLTINKKKVVKIKGNKKGKKIN